MSNESRSIDEMIADLPRNEQEIVKRLRSLILECLPRAEEADNYGAPFYRRNRLICFIWPSSIFWGSQKKQSENQKKGVALGFSQGKLFANEDGALLAEGRKQVYCMYFKSLAEINEQQIRALLFEAELIDNSFKPKR